MWKGSAKDVCVCIKGCMYKVSDLLMVNECVCRKRVRKLSGGEEWKKD